MPWSVADVDEHKKGLSAKQKETWVRVANRALAACMEGISGKASDAQRSKCEASAIRQANAVAGRVNDGGGGKAMVNRLLKAAMKKEADGEHPASHYLVVEDPEKPTTWHLRVRDAAGEVDHTLMGGAWAALHGGYRGNKYEGPGKAEAIAKLSKLYASEGMETPKHALSLDMVITKASKMADGRVRWQARANTGKFDLEDERFDESFFADIVHNFIEVQTALSKGETPPNELPIPILDIAHYSFRLPAEKRNLARAGWPERVWIDGSALMALGYFDDSPLGRLAAKAALERPVEDRRISIGVWPDWGRVELMDDGKRVYKGGRNRAYLDHLAMTAHPIDPGTILEVRSMNQKTDALDVLGEGAESLIDELEEAKTKALPDGALAKAEETVEEPDAEEEEVEAAPAEGAEEVVEPEEEEQPQELSLSGLQAILKGLFESFGEQLNKRLEPFEALPDVVEALQVQIDALAVDEAHKVKAAIDSGGVWWDELVKNSVRRKAVEGGEAKGPKQAVDSDYAAMFGNQDG